MSDVFIVDLFYFQVNKNNTTFFCIESTFYRYIPEYIKHVFYIYNKDDLHPFSIFYIISIF